MKSESENALHPPTVDEIAMICKRGPLTINREIRDVVYDYANDSHSDYFVRTLADGIDIGMRIMQAREAAKRPVFK